MAKGKEQWREKEQWQRDSNGKGEKMMTQRRQSPRGKSDCKGERAMVKGNA